MKDPLLGSLVSEWRVRDQAEVLDETSGLGCLQRFAWLVAVPAAFFSFGFVVIVPMRALGWIPAGGTVWDEPLTAVLTVGGFVVTYLLFLLFFYGGSRWAHLRLHEQGFSFRNPVMLRPLRVRYDEVRGYRGGTTCLSLELVSSRRILLRGLFAQFKGPAADSLIAELEAACERQSGRTVPPPPRRVTLRFGLFLLAFTCIPVLGGHLVFVYQEQGEIRAVDLVVSGVTLVIFFGILCIVGSVQNRQEAGE